MALNIPGLIAVIVFYLIILVTGIWASRKSKKEERKCKGERSEVSMVGGRNIGILVGVFTMTGGIFFAKPMREKKYTTMIDPFQIKYGDVISCILVVSSVISDVFWTGAILAGLESMCSLSLKMALNIPGLIAVIVFYLIILVTGIWASRKSKKEERKCKGERSEVPMVGGRNIGILVGVFTMTATNVGGGFILGTAEATYAHGLLWALGPPVHFFGSIIGGIFFAKPMREKKYTTMIDPFQIKYGDVISCILVISSVISDLFWTGAILAGLGGMMKVILGIEFYQSIIISAAIAIFYTLLGGLYSVAYTDIIQLIFIIISLASDTEVMWVIRITILIFGVTGMGLGMATSSIYGLWLLSAEISFSLVFAPLVCVLFVPSSNSYGIFVGILVEVILTLGAGLSALHIPPFIKYPGCKVVNGVYVQVFPYKTLAMVLSLVIIVAVSHLSSFLFNRGLLPETWDIYNIKRKPEVTVRNTTSEEVAEEIALNYSNPTT
ncbi:SC5A7 protein, partial [Polypterus senegalus]